MNYQKYYVHLSDLQKKKLANAVKDKKPVSLRLMKNKIIGDVPLLLTKTQINRLNRCIENGKGTIIKLSMAQLENFYKVGGFLPALLSSIAPFLMETVLPAVATGALSGLANWGVNSIADKVAGKGLNPLGVSLKYPSNGMKKKQQMGTGLFPLGV